MKASASTSQKPDRFWRRFATTTALVTLAMILVPIALVFLALVVPATFRRAHNAKRPRAPQRQPLRQKL